MLEKELVIESQAKEHWHAIHKDAVKTGAIISKEFESIDYFIDWYKVMYREGMYLDKELIKPGNKIYSPKTCLFVSTPLSTYFDYSYVRSSNYGEGIRHNKKFSTQVKVFGEVYRKTGKDLRDVREFYAIKKNMAIELAILDRSYSEFGDLINKHLMGR